MTTRHCPDCLAPVAVAPNAREGRCENCKPVRTRLHSQQRHTRVRRDPIDDLLVNATQ